MKAEGGFWYGGCVIKFGENAWVECCTTKIKLLVGTSSRNRADLASCWVVDWLISRSALGTAQGMPVLFVSHLLLAGPSCVTRNRVS